MVYLFKWFGKKIESGKPLEVTNQITGIKSLPVIYIGTGYGPIK